MKEDFFPVSAVSFFTFMKEVRHSEKVLELINGLKWDALMATDLLLRKRPLAFDAFIDGFIFIAFGRPHDERGVAGLVKLRKFSMGEFFGRFRFG